jgi:hypothetical protein
VLEPVVRDEFQPPDGVALVFRRDSANRVTACEVFAGRVRKILFT